MSVEGRRPSIRLASSTRNHRHPTDWERLYRKDYGGSGAWCVTKSEIIGCALYATVSVATGSMIDRWPPRTLGSSRVSPVQQNVWLGRNDCSRRARRIRPGLGLDPFANCLHHCTALGANNAICYSYHKLSYRLLLDIEIISDNVYSWLNHWQLIKLYCITP